MRSSIVVLALSLALLSTVLAAPIQARFASPSLVPSPSAFLSLAPSRIDSEPELLSASWSPNTPFAADSVVWHGSRQYVANRAHISDLEFDLRLWTAKPDDEEVGDVRPLRVTPTPGRQIVIADTEDDTFDPSAMRDVRHTPPSRLDWYDWHAVVRGWLLYRSTVAVNVQ